MQNQSTLLRCAARGARVATLGLALALGANQANAQADNAPTDGLTWADLLNSDATFKLYGFLRLDAMYNDSRANDPQIPYIIRSEDSSGVPAGTVADENDSEAALSARLTRLGLTFDGGTIDGLGNPDLGGKVEIDFYNIGLPDSDSRNALRMRLAYLTLTWDHWRLLAGQTWDAISPLNPVVNNDLVMWGAGNTGDRRPQLTVRNTTAAGAGQLITDFGIGLTGAVGGQTVLGGLRSGENSGRPMVHARVGYHGKTDAGGAYQLGVWAHNSEERFDPGTAGGGAAVGEEDFDSSSVGVDFVVPISGNTVAVKGEYFMGENLRDVRGGILQGVNFGTMDEIESKGGWVEGSYKATDHCTLYAGYSFDDPDDDDLAANAFSKNTVPYAAARWQYGSLRFGFEYLNWTTEYVGLEDGDANRVVGWIAFYF